MWCGHSFLVQFWDIVHLLDKRHVADTDAMYDACLEHLEKASSTGVTESYITVRLLACPLACPPCCSATATVT